MCSIFHSWRSLNFMWFSFYITALFCFFLCFRTWSSSSTLSTASKFIIQSFYVRVKVQHFFYSVTIKARIKITLIITDSPFVLFFISSAKMIIVDMPWIMNGEKEFISFQYQRNNNVIRTSAVNTFLFQPRGKLWSRGWVLRRSASSSSLPGLRSRRTSAQSICRRTWVERYVFWDVPASRLAWTGCSKADSWQNSV